MDVYVNAVFACGWSKELGTNSDFAKSRTGYIIEVMGCPVLWVARLQTTAGQIFVLRAIFRAVMIDSIRKTAVLIPVHPPAAARLLSNLRQKKLIRRLTQLRAHRQVRH